MEAIIFRFKIMFLPKPPREGRGSLCGPDEMSRTPGLSQSPSAE